MEYSLTFPGKLYSELSAHLSWSENESAAYLICRRSESEKEIRLLVTRMIPVDGDAVISTSSTHMSITSASFLAAMKECERTKSSFFFIHSHPKGPYGHSVQDDREERSLFRTAYNRIRSGNTHGSIVFAGADKLVGRVWLQDGRTHPITTFRIIGSKFQFLYNDLVNLPKDLFDRHVRAFGPDLQQILHRLNIGIVGCGGTGSSVAEQLIRMGIGTLTVVDEGGFEPSNVTRGYGSSVFDTGIAKTEILKRLAAHIGLDTRVLTVRKNCTYASTVRALRACDVVFGCTDDQWGRSLLNKFAIYYLIPVFDMGVKIHSDTGKIRSIQGRVTTLLPEMACLFCRNRISAEGVRRESLDALNPSEAGSLRREGYIPDLEGPAASMIPFTTSIAAAAVGELVHRLTQFGGIDRTTTEILHRFSDSRIGPNSTPPQTDCMCSNPDLAGRGDCEPLLDCTWRPE